MKTPINLDSDLLRSRGNPLIAHEEEEAPPAPAKAKKKAATVRLSVDEAVQRLPQEMADLFVDRLRGQFREVRPYEPPPSAQKSEGGADELPVDDVEVDEGEED